MPLWTSFVQTKKASTDEKFNQRSHYTLIILRLEFWLTRRLRNGVWIKAAIICRGRNVQPDLPNNDKELKSQTGLPEGISLRIFVRFYFYITEIRERFNEVTLMILESAMIPWFQDIQCLRQVLLNLFCLKAAVSRFGRSCNTVGLET